MTDIASLISESQEPNLALASLNFDFSLVKVEAPPSFHGVGAALTATRRDAAESGSLHVTARKLDALFKGHIRPSPHLINAYGARASEIAKSSPVHSEPDQAEGSLFSEWIGPDSTSIWAAATSGSAAIAAHLLACLLARMWKPSEAVSIWVQILQARKLELERNAQQNQSRIAEALTSQVTLTREQLAEWDNSARAWIQHADGILEVQQTKVKTLIDDLKLQLTSKSTLYRSVMHTWVVASQGMEEVLKGSSRTTSDAPLVLALSSWHLYPDISLHGGAPIQQNDSLFDEGTVVTLNLEEKPSKPAPGIYWSLSLSHLCFYGSPIDTERSYATDSSRISFTQLLLVAIGSLSSIWRDSDDRQLPLDDICEVLRMLSQHSIHQGSEWIPMLAQAATEFLASKDAIRAVNKKLIMLGRSRGAGFLAPPPHHPMPLFGLTNFDVFLNCLKDVKERIKQLQKYSSLFFSELDPFDVIIRYRVDTASAKGVSSNSPEESGLREFDAEDKRHKLTKASDFKTYSEYEYATVLPYSVDGSETRYFCWAAQTNSESYHNVNLTYLPKADILWANDKEKKLQLPVNFFRSSALSTEGALKPDACSTYRRFLGPGDSAAIFVRETVLESCEQEWPRSSGAGKSKPQHVPLEEAIDALSHDALDLRSWDQALKDLFHQSSYFPGLVALAAAHRLYSDLEGATVDPGIVAKPITDWKWASSLLDGRMFVGTPMSCKEAFSCIANLDSGGIDISISHFRDVMAISYGNSIYVSDLLLRDPAEKKEIHRVEDAHRVRRLNGNVGMAGLTLLIPPPILLVREPELGSYGLAEYRGEQMDLFSGTTLRLSFTNWSTPIDPGRSRLGRRDAEARIVESVVSVFHDGRWIGDIDIIAALQKRDLMEPVHGHFLCRKCTHEPDGTLQGWMDDEITPILSICTWDEFLQGYAERPEGPGVVMAHKNRNARLACMALGVQRGLRVFFNDEACSECLDDLESFGGMDLVCRAIFV